MSPQCLQTGRSFLDKGLVERGLSELAAKACASEEGIVPSEISRCYFSCNVSDKTLLRAGEGSINRI